MTYEELQAMCDEELHLLKLSTTITLQEKIDDVVPIRRQLAQLHNQYAMIKRIEKTREAEKGPPPEKARQRLENKAAGIFHRKLRNVPDDVVKVLAQEEVADYFELEKAFKHVMVQHWPLPVAHELAV